MPTQTPSVPVHLPVAPYVPVAAKKQRYFSRGKQTFGCMVKGGDSHKQLRLHAHAEITVMRFADDDFARVEQRLATGHHFSTSELACTAQELRDIALRLLDAAHDLEVNPAANLLATLAMDEGGAQ